jgi:hypothetical protein
MTFRTSILLASFLSCITCLTPSASAQNSSFLVDAPGSSSAQPATLPDSPGAIVSASDSDADAPQSVNAPPTARTHRTGHYDALIDPTEIAPPLTASNKVGMGLKKAVSPFAVLGWIGSATYGETFNRSPNYGQDGKDYAQRLGASAARASSETIFTTSVLAPILHEDPRYYVLGPGHNGFHRTFYAISQIFITPTDKGTTSVNYALLGGNLAGAALTQAYYPTVNRGPGEVLTTFGTSLAGSLVAYLFDEFLYDEAHIVQLREKLHEQ